MSAPAMPVVALAAVVLDVVFGEPRRWHPLAGFGALAAYVEAQLNGGRMRKLRGLFAVALLLVPATVAAAWLASLANIGLMFQTVALYFCIGHRSLREHALRVAAALQAGDLPRARRRVGAIVSRDTQDMDETRVAAAAVESVLENGNDAVFGALFWFAVAGAPGAVAYRLANTLDAMWGYRMPRFADFGWTAARLDDVLNYLPARLTALSYALLGHTRAALRCWQRQAPAFASPNGGPVMAAGAGSLGVVLGGGAFYHGQWQAKPLFGSGDIADRDDIARALRLVARSLLLWLFVIAAVAFTIGMLRRA